MKKITKTPLARIVGIAATKTSLACPQARCNGPATLPTGTPEPVFALESILDQTVRLREFRGQVVVLVNNKGFRHATASLQKTILIAEDSPDDVFLLCRAYSKTGLPYDLRFVRNGQEAIDYLEGNAPFDRQSHPLPAAIILDNQMPLLTGLEVLAWLKLQPTLSHIPAVVHSSSILDIDRNKAGDLARRYFVKTPSQDDRIAMFQSIAVSFITDSEAPAAAASTTAANAGDRAATPQYVRSLHTK